MTGAGNLDYKTTAISKAANHLTFALDDTATGFGPPPTIDVQIIPDGDLEIRTCALATALLSPVPTQSALLRNSSPVL